MHGLAFGAELAEGEGIVAFGQAVALVVHDKSVVEVDGSGKTEEMLEDAVDGRGREQVFSTGDVSDVLKGIVHYDSEVVGCTDVFPGENYVVDEGGVDGVCAVSKVLERESLAKRGGNLCVQSPGMG